MTGTVGPARRSRQGGLAAVLVLLLPLLVVASPPGTRPAFAAPSAQPGADAGRIAFAGTEHRSMGRVSGTASSDPLFGPGPAHFDQHSSARGDLLVFTSLRDSTKAQVYLRGKDGAVRKLTTGRDAGHPALAPDGGSVVFDSAEPSSAGSQRDLWQVGTDGSGLRRLTDTPADETSPTYSPDGTRIAYSSDADPLRGKQIYTRAVAGGAQTRISDGPAGDATEPTWNPAGDPAHRDLVAYTLDTGPDTGPRLRVTDGKGTDEPLLAGGQADWKTRSAAWLPDGDQVLFLSPNEECVCTTTERVYRARAGSDEGARLVLREDRAVASPTWLGSADDGETVVTRTSAPARNVVTLQDARQDGSDPRDLGLTLLKEDPAAYTNTDPAVDPLFHPADGYDPWTERQSYTPDGRRIVVTRFEDSDAGRIERIWLAEADGSSPHPLPLAGRGAADRDTDPAFSPDGKFLAFTRTSPRGPGGEPGPGRILVADAATGEIVDRIVPPAGQADRSDAQPTWSADGTTIAFTRTQVIGGNGGNKHIWTAPVDALERQRDLSAANCPGECQVIDDSPAFSPDGKDVAFNRKDGGGRVNERNGILLTGADGEGCRVLLPAAAAGGTGACGRELPDTRTTGPFQPRDVAWSPDGSRLVLSSRRAVDANAPEGLSVLEPATGRLTPLTDGLPGRQKEPSYQQSVDLSVDAPGAAPAVRVGGTRSVTATVTNHGPAPSPATTLTVAVPPGVRLERLTATAGDCPAATPQCALGVLAPGAEVRITARLTGVAVGDQQVGWSVSGAVVDPRPGDNATDTVVPVEADAPPPPPPSASPSPPPGSAPPPSSAPPRPPARRTPSAGPGVTVRAQPAPGYVGGHVVVTYTVRNGRNALATGLRLKLGLPPDIPAGRLPAGCSTGGRCALGDLAPGASTVLRVVLAPDKALRTTVTATLSTSGTDADPRDNVDKERLRILQPRIVAVPEVGKPGFVTSVRGKDFPPGTPVRLSWKPGITAAAAPALPGGTGRFTAQLLILSKDATGPRRILAKGAGFSPVSTTFLVVSGSVAPPDEVARR
ncbi:hypothetical protein [Streptomyces qinglanensis]|uniref:hypothetical protein n=1 Tax=Streptomyces qinglanensis TaxID=943816 RepID=UPI0037882533